MQFQSMGLLRLYRLKRFCVASISNRVYNHVCKDLVVLLCTMPGFDLVWCVSQHAVQWHTWACVV